MPEYKAILYTVLVNSAGNVFELSVLGKESTLQYYEYLTFGVLAES